MAGISERAESLAAVATSAASDAFSIRCQALFETAQAWWYDVTSAGGVASYLKRERLMNHWKIGTSIKALIGVLMLLGATTAMADLTKEACDGVKEAAEDMQSQLPLSIDYATDLVGMVAIHAGGVCTVNYAYLIKTEAFAEGMAAENDLSIAENIEWLKTDEGGAVMIEILGELGQESAETELKPIASIPNMVFIYRHSFDEPGIQPVRTVVMDTTTK